jgi:hypothetical protein
MIFFRTCNGRAHLCIRLAENAKEWLQHHTSLSAQKTLLQHKRQARLTQPLVKNGEKMGTELLDRVTTNNTHKHDQNSELTRTNIPLLMRLERQRKASEWQGLAELGKESCRVWMVVYIAPQSLTP